MLVAVTSSGQLMRTLGDNVPEKPTAAPSLFAGLDGDVIAWWTDTDLPAELLLVVSDGQIKRIATADCDGGDRKGGISIVKLNGPATLVSAAAFDENTRRLLRR